MVADLYRDWYRHREMPAGRLLVECFVVLEPWWTLRTGSVPYWMVFNSEPSWRSLISHLDTTDSYDEIRLMLFSHGVESPGLATIEMWQALAHARKIGVFTGVDIRAYPRTSPASHARTGNYPGSATFTRCPNQSHPPTPRSSSALAPRSNGFLSE